MANNSSVLISSTSTLDARAGLKHLERLSEEGYAMLSTRPVSADDYTAWNVHLRNMLRDVFGPEHPNVSSVMTSGNTTVFRGNRSEAALESARAADLTKRLAKLRGVTDYLKSRFEAPMEESVAQPTDIGEGVFLVHGHDQTATQSVARAIERLGLRAVVMMEETNQGQTIIEKFERTANAAFAVVLLTGDDRGATKTTEYAAQKLRARQNVIFELGFFIGKYGRSRVCALYQPGVEIPSDIQGLLYHELDDRGAWKLLLAKEMKDAGLPVDLNRL